MRAHFERVKQQKKAVDLYHKYMSTLVSWTEEDHEKQLKRLWSAWKPGVDFPGQKHDAWEINRISRF